MDNTDLEVRNTCPLTAYESVSHARASLAQFSAFYNTQRPHSSLARRTTDEFYFDSLPAMRKAA